MLLSSFFSRNEWRHILTMITVTQYYHYDLSRFISLILSSSVVLHLNDPELHCYEYFTHTASFRPLSAPNRSLVSQRPLLLREFFIAASCAGHRKDALATFSDKESPLRRYKCCLIHSTKCPSQNNAYEVIFALLVQNIGPLIANMYTKSKAH